jgi:methylated-DNA-protein-cysteine methyltransferase related protein
MEVIAATFADRVYHTVRRVPRGRVASYGAIAAAIGSPRAARAVGRALAGLPDDNDVPWWRIIGGDGRVSIRGDFNAAALQTALLRREGIRFGRDGRVDWNRYGWRTP